MSVIVHEVSHGYVAYILGDPTAKYAGRLTLNPLKHLDPVGSILVPIITSLAGFPFGWAKPVPYNPYNLKAGKWGPAIVAAAGPLSNLFLAIVFGLISRFFFGYFSLPAQTLLFTIIFVNISLGIFNLLPVAPLDGSKLLFALLPYHLRYIEEFMTRNQLFLVFILIVFLNSSGVTWLVNFEYFLIKLILGA
jgi:Zn-dependent protease